MQTITLLRIMLWLRKQLRLNPLKSWRYGLGRGLVVFLATEKTTFIWKFAAGKFWLFALSKKSATFWGSLRWNTADIAIFYH